MNLVDGAMLGPYRILGQLGRGGTASVYKGFYSAMERTVVSRDRVVFATFERRAAVTSTKEGLT